ncbi:hypothetical protein KR093_006877, partial [Drosophila rubida]
ASLAVGRSEESAEEGAQQRFRVFKKNDQPEGRTFSSLLAMKGCNQSPTETVTTIEASPTVITGSLVTTSTPLSSSSSASAARDLNNDEDDEADDDEENDDEFIGLYHDNEDALVAFDGDSFGASHRGYKRPSRNNAQLSSDNTRQVDYELLRRQEEENKLLRQQIQYLRHQNQQNRRRAQRARRQQRRRNQLQRRQLMRQNRNNRRRLNRRNRINRRRNNRRRP